MLRFWSEKGRDETLGTANPSKIRAMRNDGGSLVHHAKATTLVKIYCAFKKHYRGGSKRKGSGANNILDDVVTLLGKDGARVFLNQISEQLGVIGIHPGNGGHVRLEFPASGYVSGYPVPTLDDLQLGSSVSIPDTTLRRFQRVAARKNFYKHSCRQDNVMVDNGESAMRSTSDPFIPIWFAKALTFIRVIIEEEDLIWCN